MFNKIWMYCNINDNCNTASNVQKKNTPLKINEKVGNICVTKALENKSAFVSCSIQYGKVIEAI